MSFFLSCWKPMDLGALVLKTSSTLSSIMHRRRAVFVKTS
jgi:hypothetical protein